MTNNSPMLRLSLLAALVLAACSEPPLAGRQVGEACTGAAGTAGECAFGLVCLEGTCQLGKDAACTPKTLSCDEAGNVVVCKDDGTGHETQSKCAAGCDDGACRPSDVCVSDATRCNGDDLVRCRPDGSGWDPYETCERGCDQKTNGCIDSICSPGSRRCTPKGTIETCTTIGDGWVEHSCSEGICLQEGTGANASARCQLNACEPSSIRCEGKSIVICAESGLEESVVQVCPNSCVDGNCVDRVCSPGQRRCSFTGSSVEVCNGDGSGWAAVPCSTDGSLLCREVTGNAGNTQAQCVPVICDPGATRCESDRRYACTPSGSSETLIEQCAFGCGVDGSCAQPVCALGETRCEGNVREICRPDRRDFVFEQYCASGCSESGSSSGARCVPPVCRPFDARCSGNGVERCAADGLSWEPALACAEGESCENAACVGAQTACLAGETRCFGNTLQLCGGDEPGFADVGACLGACANGGCDSAGSCTPFALSMPGTRADETLPADGRSRFLVLSEVLLDMSGRQLPEGTLVTVVVDSETEGLPAATLLAGDADPAQPGVQLRVVDGRIDFVVRAPLLGEEPGSTRVSAFVGGKAACRSTLVLNFDHENEDVFTAEDFTTTANRLSNGSVSGWNTGNGTLTLTPFDAGDGRDGNLVVAAGATVNLSTHSASGRGYADMASAKVLEIRGASLAIDGSTLPFEAPGTKLLLINMRGSPGRYRHVGRWEYLETSGIEGNVLKLKSPVTGTYSETGNLDIYDQAVRLIRVPQYAKATIEGTLTVNAWDGNAGGLIVFFANSRSESGGASVVSGTIDARSKGYRGASRPAPMRPGTTNSTSKAVFGYDNCIASTSPRNIPYGHSGEGLEGLWNSNSPVGGPGLSGGGFMCGNGNRPPTRTPSIGNGPGDTSYANEIATLYQGSAGSHATVGNSTCSSYGPGSVYGSPLLTNIHFGGGSGSVARSQSESCFETRPCCRTVGGQCCGNGSDNTALSGHPHTQCNGCSPRPICNARGLTYNENFAGANGGGIVLVTAAELEVSGSGFITAQGEGTKAPVPAGLAPNTYNFGGAGGSIYLRADKLKLSSAGRLNASGTDGGGQGRIRIDASSIDSTFLPTWTSPAATHVKLDANSVESLTVLQLLASEEFTSATVTALPVGKNLSFGPEGSLLDGASLRETNIRMNLSADAGSTWGALDVDAQVDFDNGAVSKPGRAARWRLSPNAGFLPGSTRGFVIRYTKGPPTP